VTDAVADADAPSDGDPAAERDPASGTTAGADAVAGTRQDPGADATPAPVAFAQLRDAWPEILEAVQKTNRSSWMVVYTATPRALDGDVLTLAFRSANDVAGFRPRPGASESVSEHLRAAITEVLGIRVKFLPRVDAETAPSTVPTPALAESRDQPAPASASGSGPESVPGPERESASVPESGSAPGPGPESGSPPESGSTSESGSASESASEPGPVPESESAPERESMPEGSPGAGLRAARGSASAPASTPAPEPGGRPAATAGGAQIDADGWAVVSIPSSYDDDSAGVAAPAEHGPSAGRPVDAGVAVDSRKGLRSDAPLTSPTRPAIANRYGEAVVRELLKAEFIEEHTLAPRDAPVTFDAPDDIPPAPDDIPPPADEDR
jgi:DNA polymerase-3 subunit gamma/tau